MHINFQLTFVLCPRASQVSEWLSIIEVRLAWSQILSLNTGRVTVGKLLHSFSLSCGEEKTMLLPAHGENAWDTLSKPSGRQASAGGGTHNPPPQR